MGCFVSCPGGWDRILACVGKLGYPIGEAAISGKRFPGKREKGVLTQRANENVVGLGSTGKTVPRFAAGFSRHEESILR
jgi:hypothetical protein